MNPGAEWQPAPAHLGEALALLDTTLQLTDLPPEASIVLAEVYSDLLDVRPPYKPVEPAVAGELAWRDAAHRAADALGRLIEQDPSPAPGLVVRWALAARTARKVAMAPVAAPISGDNAG